MQKVISINLNGNAYQLDEAGYDALREYLARAEHALEGNPDRTEIMSDLEQAIADKCQKFLGPHKSVVTAAEVEEIVKEMGPIDAGTADESAAGAEAGQQAAPGKRPASRLYRLADGAMIAGVCNGLAAHFGVDVTVIRVFVVLAVLLTKGAGIFAYLVMMFIIPEASTPEQRAAAGNAPFNAKDVVERVKAQGAETTRQLRGQWRQQQRQWRRSGWTTGAPFVYGPPPLVAVLLPVFALVHLALFLVMAAMMISLVNTGAVLKWPVPPEMPVWAAAMILLVVYQIVVSPFRAVQQRAWQPRPEVQPAWYAFWNAVIWLIGLAFVIWLASNHIPEIRDFLQQLPDLVREFTDAVRNLWSRSRAR